MGRWVPVGAVERNQGSVRLAPPQLPPSRQHPLLPGCDVHACHDPLFGGPAHVDGHTTLGEDNRRLVAESPLLLAALLAKEEYRPQELSGFYSVLGLGMAIENIWLTTVELGMGIQFVSTPMEFPDAWAEIKALLRVPDDLELMAVYRLGYLPAERARPRIDWTSSHRKRLSQYVFRDVCTTPEPDAEQA